MVFLKGSLGGELHDFTATGSVLNAPILFGVQWRPADFNGDGQVDLIDRGQIGFVPSVEQTRLPTSLHRVGRIVAMASWMANLILWHFSKLIKYVF